MKRFKTSDIRLASLIWHITGECPEVEGDYPKVFFFSYRPEIPSLAKSYYSGADIPTKVSELFEKYNALKNMIRMKLEGENDGR